MEDRGREGRVKSPSSLPLRRGSLRSCEDWRRAVKSLNRDLPELNLLICGFNSVWEADHHFRTPQSEFHACLYGHIHKVGAGLFRYDMSRGPPRPYNRSRGPLARR